MCETYRKCSLLIIIMKVNVLMGKSDSVLFQKLLENLPTYKSKRNYLLFGIA